MKMIYVRKYAYCDGCKQKLATSLVGKSTEVNREMSDLLYRNGWKFNGPDRVYCPACQKERATRCLTRQQSEEESNGKK